MDWAAFSGYLLGVLLVGALIPIVVGGFYPWGKRATSTRTGAAWTIAIIWAVLTLMGGGSVLAVAISVAVVAGAFILNRSRPSNG